MKPSARISFAERLGQALGRMWQAYLRQERKVNGWLVAQGLPAGVSKVLLLAIKLVALGVLLYVAFWLTLLLVFAILAAWAMQYGALDEEFEWPFTDQDELRKTPGYDPVLYNDVAHPDYPDEKDD